MKGRVRDMRCAFCGKHRDQVRRLVAGPGVFICDQCVALCNEVLAHAEGPEPSASNTPARRGWLSRLFRPKPPTGLSRYTSWR